MSNVQETLRLIQDGTLSSLANFLYEMIAERSEKVVEYRDMVGFYISQTNDMNKKILLAVCYMTSFIFEEPDSIAVSTFASLLTHYTISIHIMKFSIDIYTRRIVHIILDRQRDFIAAFNQIYATKKMFSEREHIVMLKELAIRTVYTLSIIRDLNLPNEIRRTISDFVCPLTPTPCF